MSKTHVNTFEGFKFKRSIKNFLETLKNEIAQKSELRGIFIKYLKHQFVTEEENEFVREQLLDILKILGMGTLFILPGSMLVIPFIIKLSNKYKFNIIPNSLKVESMTSDEMVNLIQDGTKIYVKYIQDYPNHKKEDSYRAVDIDKDGNIALDIDNNLYYTKVEWVEGIDEMNFIEIGEDSTEAAASKPDEERSDEWQQNLEYTELLKDHGGYKKVVSKMMSEYNLDYSNCSNEEELYRALKIDKMI